MHLLQISDLSESDITRFQGYLKRNEASGCLEWTRGTFPWGHGRFWWNGTHKPAHQIAFVLGGGVLTPENPLVLHHCDNPKCCEMSHLYAGNYSNNSVDMAKRNRGTKSKHGLPYGVGLSGRGYSSAVALAGHRFYLGYYDTIEEAAEIARKTKEDYYAGRLDFAAVKNIASSMAKKRNKRSVKRIFVVVTESGTINTGLHKEVKAAYWRRAKADARVEDETTSDGYVTAFVQEIDLFY